MKKGKRPLPPGGIPDPEHPRLSKDEGQQSLRLLPLFNAEVYNAHFVFTRIRISPLLSYFEKIAHMSVIFSLRIFVALLLCMFGCLMQGPIRLKVL